MISGPVIDALRRATRETEYEGKLYLVGGIIRDQLLGFAQDNDVDLVLEGDAVALAEFLFRQKLTVHAPVVYPRFGTAMIHIAAGNEIGAVELVSARKESYHADSRKPEVVHSTLRDDVFRRDFTINTLVENLHSGERLDLTGQGLADLEAGIIRTPLNPEITFYDDPLRMLRAVRFAARFGFTIHEETWNGILTESERLRPPTIAHERIRDEFVKVVKLPGPSIRCGMELLLESGLLERFLPQMLPMVGCTQGNWHLYDVWTHTLVAMEHLPNDARLETRLGLLWHDVGKPPTRTEDERGVHFYTHQAVGAEMAAEMMRHLKFSNEEIRDVRALVALHMRLGDYKPEWLDGPVRRLIRDCGAYLDDLFMITACDVAASNIPEADVVNLPHLRARIDAINARLNIVQVTSPLDGIEIMKLLGAGQGPYLREAKNLLTNEVIEGRIADGDKEAAAKVLLEWWQNRTNG